MATGTVRISRVDTSSFGWTVLVQVIEADRVKIGRDRDLSKSFRRFEFGDFQVCTTQIDPFFPHLLLYWLSFCLTNLMY